mmetsp:Transcript_7805/g.17931  ORF Transcript_7805/g.17931 Transcript_7805/m.17931 type:complete len:267 (+) Transcript_7805:32-832(+)
MAPQPRGSLFLFVLLHRPRFLELVVSEWSRLLELVVLQRSRLLKHCLVSASRCRRLLAFLIPSGRAPPGKPRRPTPPRCARASPSASATLIRRGVLGVTLALPAQLAIQPQRLREKRSDLLHLQASDVRDVDYNLLLGPLPQDARAQRVDVLPYLVNPRVLYVPQEYADGVRVGNLRVGPPRARAGPGPRPARGHDRPRDLGVPERQLGAEARLARVALEAKDLPEDVGVEPRRGHDLGELPPPEHRREPKGHGGGDPGVERADGA